MLSISKMLQLVPQGWLILVVAAAAAVKSEECSQLDRKNVTANIGWPVRLSCYDIYYDSDDGYDYDYDSDKSQSMCIMTYTETNETFHNATFSDDDDIGKINEALDYEIQNVTEETPKNIEVRIQSEDDSSVCKVQQVTLVISPLAHGNCQTQPDPFESKVTQEKAKDLLCEVKSEPRFDVSKQNVSWLYNCGTDLPAGVTAYNKQLVIQQPSYNVTPGSYSCFVTRNGQRRFMMNYQVCIEPEEVPSISIGCDEVSEFEEGSIAKINCYPKSAEGGKKQHYDVIFWKTYDNKTLDLSSSGNRTSCKAYSAGVWYLSEGDPDVSCILIYDNEPPSDPVCVTSPTDTETWNDLVKETTTSSLTITYQIKNFRSNYSGLYQAYIKNEVSSDGVTAYPRLEVANDKAKDQAKAIGIAVGSMVGVLILITICVVLHIEIKWIWKRYFAQFDVDPKEYGAYIKYHWSNEEGERIENQNYTYFIKHMKRTLRAINCPTYDHQEDVQMYQWSNENISKIQQICDRIIVVLTPQYLMSDQNMFDIYANFLESTFIFIKAPEVDNALKTMKTFSRNALLAAMRRNYVLEWSGRGRRLSGRFRRRLELAMPKRKKELPTVIYDGVAQTTE